MRSPTSRGRCQWPEVPNPIFVNVIFALLSFISEFLCSEQLANTYSYDGVLIF
jgi:hypothetical protein